MMDWMVVGPSEVPLFWKHVMLLYSVWVVTGSICGREDVKLFQDILKWTNLEEAAELEDVGTVDEDVKAVVVFCEVWSQTWQRKRGCEAQTGAAHVVDAVIVRADGLCMGINSEMKQNTRICKQTRESGVGELEDSVDGVVIEAGLRKRTRHKQGQDSNHGSCTRRKGCQRQRGSFAVTLPENGNS